MECCTKLQGDCENDRGAKTVKVEFLESMEERMKEVMDTVNSVQGQWDVLSSVNAEKECLGYI